MDIVSAIVTPVVESLMVPVKKHVGFLISCTKYVSDMSIKMNQLEAARLGVEDHMNRNKRNNFHVPSEARVWLEEVGKIDAQVKDIPNDVGSCFDLKLRHKLGRKAFKIIEEINRLREEKSRINWTDHPIPLGRVDSTKASTSTPSSHHNDFESREQIFIEALKALEPDHKSHMIALCGMGGVGKTTMMEKIKNVVIEKKMFNFIIEATIGEKTDPIVIQQAVADFLGIDLKESTKAARAIRLRKRFEADFDGGKKKILVILDDIWHFVDLNDIGLSPLPNQGVDFKVLLTSRDQDVCSMMGVELNLVFNVEVIKDQEAQSFFRQLVKMSEDFDLCKIGDEIASRCHGLPIAIKTIAHTLKGKNKHAWEDTLARLKHHDVDEVLHRIFEMSYNNLQNEETRSTLLLCVLFPEDFDTPMEDLVKYGWGLKLFKNVYTIREARNRLNTCIDRLIHANLLIQSQHVTCVKMHDLVRAFVLDMCSKGEHASVVGNMSKWPAKHTSEFCKRISLTCTGRSEFPRDFKYPNLLLLKVMHGDSLLKFSEDFYEEMKKLEVIAYDKMRYPLLPTSPQCSTNLRTLCLHQCSLNFDCSSIGDLLNLEVLSFAHCSIGKLPSTIGNLKELKLLDLTGCFKLHIDDGVLTNLINLEELYMSSSEIEFNGDELAKRSKGLTALEIEFFNNNVPPKNMSFKKLERFKISLGGRSKENNGQNRHSYENTLMLVTNKCELLDSRMNELFEKAEELHLQVDGINDLGDVLVESSNQPRLSFYNLRVLDICECTNLRYLFTVDVANGLMKLERLTISLCLVLETLVGSENSGVEVLKFPALKFLSLDNLPKLMGLCNVVNVFPYLTDITLSNCNSIKYLLSPLMAKHLCNLKSVEISDCDAIEEVVSNRDDQDEEMATSHTNTTFFPHLDSLILMDLKSLKRIEGVGATSIHDKFQCSQASWSLCQYFKRMHIGGCDELLNVIPSHAVGQLPKLEELGIFWCKSMTEIFETNDVGDTGFAPAIPRLTNTTLLELPNLKILQIECCGLLENIFTSSTLESLKKLEVLLIIECKAIQVIVKEEKEEASSKDVVFPCLKALGLVNLPNLKGFFLGKNDFQWPLLDTVEIYGCPQMMIFTSGHSFAPKLNYIHTGLGKHGLECGLNFDWTNASHENQLYNSSTCSTPVITYFLQFPWAFSNLMEVDVRFHNKLCNMDTIFPCDELLKPQNLEEVSMDEQNQPKCIWKSNWWTASNLSNLTKVSIKGCGRLEHLFSSCMVGSLVQLQVLHINRCYDMEVVVKQVQDSDEVIFPCLKSLKLCHLRSLKGFCLGSERFQWPSLDTLKIKNCPNVTVFTKGQSTTQKLKVIKTHFGSFDITEDVNAFITTKRQEGHRL